MDDPSPPRPVSGGAHHVIDPETGRPKSHHRLKTDPGQPRQPRQPRQPKTLPPVIQAADPLGEQVVDALAELLRATGADLAARGILSESILPGLHAGISSVWRPAALRTWTRVAGRIQGPYIDAAVTVLPLAACAAYQIVGPPAGDQLPLPCGQTISTVEGEDEFCEMPEGHTGPHARIIR